MNWFPGHMSKAKEDIKKVLTEETDLVIEVCDARIPEISSSNWILKKIKNNKPVIKILSKRDLACPSTTKKWLRFYREGAIAVDFRNDKKIANQIFQRCRIVLPKCSTFLRPIRIIILGFPNVGKSTLANILARRKIAKTGNEPAITKKMQEIKTGSNIYLNDTPGIMLPRFEDDESKFKLGIIGTIRDTAMDYTSAAYYLVNYLRSYYPSRLTIRYKIGLEDKSVPNVESIFFLIGKYMGKKSEEQISRKVIQDFRQGYLGRISLDVPPHELENENS